MTLVASDQPGVFGVDETAWDSASAHWHGLSPARIRMPTSSKFTASPACRAAQLHTGPRNLVRSILCTLVSLGSNIGAYAELYFVEPPSWTKTDNWRPAAAPGSQYYWHDTSFAPSCQWDIGRLLSDALFVPVRRAPACCYLQPLHHAQGVHRQATPIYQ